MKRGTAFVGGTSLGLAIVAGMFALISATSVGEEGRAWPPAPERIVNWILENQTGHPGSIDVPSGQSRTLMHVPENQYFVLTEVRDLAQRSFAIVERAADGTEMVKLDGPAGVTWDYSSGSAIGVVFRPGSDVVFRNENISSNPQRINGHGRLTGYLTK